MAMEKIKWNSLYLSVAVYLTALRECKEVKEKKKGLVHW